MPLLSHPHQMPNSSKLFTNILGCPRLRPTREEGMDTGLLPAPDLEAEPTSVPSTYKPRLISGRRFALALNVLQPRSSPIQLMQPVLIPWL